MQSSILSIDIGSVTVSAIEMDLNGRILGSYYTYHHGKADQIIQNLDSEFDFKKTGAIVSPSKNSLFSNKVRIIDSQTCLIRAAKHFYDKYEAILLIGAGRFQLMHFDKNGNFSYSTTNTSCAAGTGSFLDQQAKRLYLTDTVHLCHLANENRDPLPDIASRCSVFAKTDLIHAQQSGYSLKSICDSLCKGLARNISDTLFDDEILPARVIFAGGVSKNTAVKSHLEDLIASEFCVHEYSHLFQALGAALLFLESKNESHKLKEFKPADVINKRKNTKDYVYDPLSLKLSGYPDFESGKNLEFTPCIINHPGKIMVDIYKTFNAGTILDCYLGIDIGSTSTKAIITDKSDDPVVGFYTYTHGQPLGSIMSIFETLLYLEENWKITWDIKGAGTTGSGRKFIGSIVGSDIIIDEITAHAEAAHKLNPETDTIIEIGGQDAKFTLLRNGRVTFSKMNSVCAAGTGSFIEEQAMRMDVSLDEYSVLAENSSSPMASDRCTVFMERDINHYLNQGYNTSEILAAVLHSVRDNYLKKVAIESAIGSKICFQGATAKNKALVAAFEAKLGKEIFVSKYCHLTGALGTAIMLHNELEGDTKFKGLGLIHEDIKVRNEKCNYCNNNCRITVARVKKEEVGYGFLCGRDYYTGKYVERNTSGFDLLKERSRILRVPELDKSVSGPIVGIPAALHMFEDMSFWKHFFRNLGIRTVSSESVSDPVSSGKRLAGAEFCAPMHALYGHVSWLEDKSDFIFLPASLESRTNEKASRELYCYYTQFSPAVVSLIRKEIKDKIVIPFLYHEKGQTFVVNSLYESLAGLGIGNFSLYQVRDAYNYASHLSDLQKVKIKELFNLNVDTKDDFSVVLLGRPYLILSGSLNQKIPDLIAGMGVKTFYQDMVPEKDDGLSGLLKAVPWHFASQVLKVANYIARKKGLYPVFISGFKCAPDSFVIEYFQKILDSAGKPYLILQTDEHDSNVGYETRIEAAIRSFRNHATEEQLSGSFTRPRLEQPIRKIAKDRIILFPNWDPIAGRFLTANLRRYSFDTRLLEHTSLGIQKGMASNTGQCLPLNIIAQDYIDYIKKYDLDPSKTILWMTKSGLTCNIRMYPQYTRTILQNHGNGLEKASVYTGELSHSEISIDATRHAYFAYMLSGLLRRLGCKMRPYEISTGETDKALSASIDSLEKIFEGDGSLGPAIEKIILQFKKIEVTRQKKPLVAIFGDFFVRDNDIMNQDLIAKIEEYGGEALVTPYSEYYKLISENVLRRRSINGNQLEILGYRSLLSVLKYLEKRYYKHFEPFLGAQKKVSPKEIEKNLAKFNINLYHSGESYDNILKIFHIIEAYPGISLFVQTNPAFCCPSLITEAMRSEIRKQTGIPILTITYDGTTELKNEVLAPYLLVDKVNHV